MQDFYQGSLLPSVPSAGIALLFITKLGSSCLFNARGFEESGASRTLAGTACQRFLLERHELIHWLLHILCVEHLGGRCHGKRRYEQDSIEYFPEGRSTQYLRTLAPKAINGMFFGTRVLKYWVLGPSWFDLKPARIMIIRGVHWVSPKMPLNTWRSLGSRKQSCK